MRAQSRVTHTLEMTLAFIHVPHTTRGANVHPYEHMHACTQWAERSLTHLEETLHIFDIHLDWTTSAFPYTGQ